MRDKTTEDKKKALVFTRAFSYLAEAVAVKLNNQFIDK